MPLEAISYIMQTITHRCPSDEQKIDFLDGDAELIASFHRATGR